MIFILLKNINTYHFFDHNESRSHFSVDKKHFQKSQVHHKQRESKHPPGDCKRRIRVEVTHKERRYK